LSDVQRDGNKFYVEVGIDENKSKNSWHGVFVEYGTPTQPADPGIRTSFISNKNKVKNIQKKVLAQGGVPID
jgi:HK97 gp10 family phage protein